MAARNDRKHTVTKRETARFSKAKPSENNALPAKTVNGAQAIAPAQPTGRKTKIGRLDTPDRVRREMAKIYRRTRWREIHPQEGRILTLMLRTLLDVMVIGNEQKHKAAIVKALRERGYDVPSDRTLPPPDEADNPPIDMEPST